MGDSRYQPQSLWFRRSRITACTRTIEMTLLAQKLKPHESNRDRAEGGAESPPTFLQE